MNRRTIRQDSAHFSEQVRRLGLEAQQAIRNPFTASSRLMDLSRRVQDLRKQTHVAQRGEVDCLLYRIQRDLEGRWPAARLLRNS